MIGYSLMLLLLAFAMWGVFRDRIWMITVGVLGGFGALALAAYVPGPW